MADFKRKDDYNDKTIKRIKDISEKHNDILFVPNKDCVKGYYNGLVVFEKITDQCENLVKRSPYADWDKHQDEILHEIEKGMPRDRERKTQQIIAQNNMTFAENDYSVCGFETVISTNDLHIEGKNGGPEIDLVAIRPDKGSILLIEYKCKGSSMLNGNQNIERHYEDYRAILHSEVMDSIKAEMLKAYKLLCRLHGVKAQERLLTPDGYKAQIAFLFVDKVYDKDGNIESEITDDDYSDAWDLIESKDLSDILYIRCHEPKDVVLNSWKPLAHSGLKMTN